jgi:hypothetical protein
LLGLKKNKQKKNRQRINTVALESNIENPAIPKRKFVYLLGEVYSDLDDFREGILSDVRDLSDKLDALIELIDRELSEKGERYNKGKTYR